MVDFDPYSKTLACIFGHIKPKKIRFSYTVFIFSYEYDTLQIRSVFKYCVSTEQYLAKRSFCTSAKTYAQVSYLV